MTFWSSTLHAGRKDHRCDGCGIAIPKGKKSYAESGIGSDGDFTSYRMCVGCHDLVARLYAKGSIEANETWFLYDLGEIARDAGEPFPPVLFMERMA